MPDARQPKNAVAHLASARTIALLLIPITLSLIKLAHSALDQAFNFHLAAQAFAALDALGEMEAQPHLSLVRRLTTDQSFGVQGVHVPHVGYVRHEVGPCISAYAPTDGASCRLRTGIWFASAREAIIGEPSRTPDVRVDAESLALVKGRLGTNFDRSDYAVHVLELMCTALECTKPPHDFAGSIEQWRFGEILRVYAHPEVKVPLLDIDLPFWFAAWSLVVTNMLLIAAMGSLLDDVHDGNDHAISEPWLILDATGLIPRCIASLWLLAIPLFGMVSVGCFIIATNAGKSAGTLDAPDLWLLGCQAVLAAVTLQRAVHCVRQLRRIRGARDKMRMVTVGSAYAQAIPWRRLALSVVLLALAWHEMAEWQGMERQRLNPLAWVKGEHWKTLDLDAYAVCGINDRGRFRCWGPDIAKREDSEAAQKEAMLPPKGMFSSLSTKGGYRCGVRESGQLACTGGYRAHPQEPPPQGKFTDVRLGYGFGCALATDGTVKCWGAITNQWAIPPVTFTSIAASFALVCGVAKDSTIRCWGGHPLDRVRPAPPGSYRAVSVGGAWACAVTVAGEVRCWQALEEESGPIGRRAASDLDTIPPHVRASKIDQVATSGSFACALTNGGEVLCWGLGVPEIPKFRVTALFANISVLCVLDEERRVSCWGCDHASRAMICNPDAYVQNSEWSRVESRRFDSRLRDSRAATHGPDGGVAKVDDDAGAL